MAVDPRFDRTHYVYTISTTGSVSEERTFSLGRYREAGVTLVDHVVLLDEIPSAPGSPAASLRFGPDGKLFAAFDNTGVERLEGTWRLSTAKCSA